MTTCRICQQEFAPARPLQAVCSLSCAKKVPRQQRKQKIAQDRARKEAIKPRSKWISEAQTEINRYCRLRDYGKPCICCGAPMNWNSTKPGGEIDAGHFVSIGSAPELRFTETNIAAQRKSCNRPGGAKRDSFRAGMIERFGREEVERLEGPHETRKWTVEELKAIKAEYRAKAKEYEARSF